MSVYSSCTDIWTSLPTTNIHAVWHTAWLKPACLFSPVCAALFQSSVWLDWFELIWTESSPAVFALARTLLPSLTSHPRQLGASEWMKYQSKVQQILTLRPLYLHGLFFKATGCFHPSDPSEFVCVVSLTSAKTLTHSDDLQRFSVSKRHLLLMFSLL